MSGLTSHQATLTCILGINGRGKGQTATATVAQKTREETKEAKSAASVKRRKDTSELYLHCSQTSLEKKNLLHQMIHFLSSLSFLKTYGNMTLWFAIQFTIHAYEWQKPWNSNILLCVCICKIALGPLSHRKLSTSAGGLASEGLRAELMGIIKNSVL